MLQRSDISKKFTAGSRKWPSAAFYFVGSIMENSELGIVRFVKGKPHLLHASSTAKKVIVDKDDLFEMLKLSRNVTGIRANYTSRWYQVSRREMAVYEKLKVKRLYSAKAEAIILSIRIP